ncbi:MAG TPA: AIR synthase-related protein [Deltaproteobacteria bacterium]|jgi:phosphoribosylformylglycinamidine synthase|nr:phosphoribosylformylglycinamidine synthase [Deltaproteobacteria bacterium]OQC28735.1 MAG: Phosphoribosylformylglycinamidine synthase 2 [Deltaproteobacteria bacterium ADurb.Bin072]HRW79890.1 AIR synthase-related protein [Desulfomonilia bacterium]HNQ84719.1 AIR synthase-related protein [Deltaproteobacteria bacterium]HNS88451.1 AIR synthase-related protein [Deltaproteobacteria bacterium]
MAIRVEVGLKEHLFDARGARIKKQLLHAFPHLTPPDNISCFDVYHVDADVAQASLQEAFCDPVIQDMAVGIILRPLPGWYIEVGFKPGVTDNVGHSAQYALELITGGKIQVYSARGYLIEGAYDHDTAQAIATECLANSLIHTIRIFRLPESRRIDPLIPRVTGFHEPMVEEISLDLSEDELLRLSQTRTLALTAEEMQTIARYISSSKTLKLRASKGLTNRITDVELECLAQTWSEHCKHKIFNATIAYEENGRTRKIKSLFATYIKGATAKIRKELGTNDICVSVFSDNAGVIRFDEEHNLVFKVETHNSPSALDPYGGALTGIVGVNRDPFGTGMGARLIFNTDVFCFASPFHAAQLPPKILHPLRIFEGVREGVEHGGNKSGIPTVNGCIVFDERYLGKPLVYCGTAGIMPREIGGEPSHVKKVVPGDLIVMAGGRIGKDGIHGATFSSEELHEESPTSAVQIGDPITQKKLTDFLIIARDRGLYRAITDNGAGGLSSSVGEMATACGGCHIELEKPPLKYHGLSPWEILLSEAQERMTLAVPPGRIDAFMALSSRMDVESTVIGTFTDSGFFHCTYEGRTVAYLSLDFLHNGLPPMVLRARWSTPAGDGTETPDPPDHGSKLREMLGRLNICSKEYVVRQYDHEVQAGSVVKPLVGDQCDGPSDAAVVRPLLDSEEGVVVANGIIPRYSDLDTYHMAACALDEALRNFICVGGNPDHWAFLDNFCWCDPVAGRRNPDGEYKLAQLVRANKALYDYALAYACPMISGKDSMKNDYIGGDTKISVPPTILISVIGTIEDVKKAVTMDIKQPGSLIFMLGVTKKELGCSEYLASWGKKGSRLPAVDAKKALRRYRLFHEAARQGLIPSAHDCSDGGLAVCLAEMAFSGGYGMEIDLGKVKAERGMSDTEILYSESASRIVIEVVPEKRKAVMDLFGRDAVCIGSSSQAPVLFIRSKSGQPIVSEAVADLKAAWKKTLDF